MSFVNKAYIEGYVYEHELEKRVTGKDSNVPNTEYIRGSVTVATDEKMLNTVNVNFVFVTKTFKSGSANSTFTFLNDLIEGKHKTVMGSSKEEAVKVKIDTAIEVNDFYPKEGNKISDRLVSDVRFGGGFIHPITAFKEAENKRATFKTDVVLSAVAMKDDEDATGEEAILKGFAFNFRDELIPIKFDIVGKGAIDYFEGLLADGDLVYTNVWGSYVVQHSENKKITKSAFGDEDYVDCSDKVQKKFIVTGADADLPEWPNEDVELVDFMKGKMAERNTMLATKKAEAEERLKKANDKPANNVSASVKDSEFDF